MIEPFFPDEPTAAVRRERRASEMLDVRDELDRIEAGGGSELFRPFLWTFGIIAGASVLFSSWLLVTMGVLPGLMLAIIVGDRRLRRRALQRRLEELEARPVDRLTENGDTSS